MRRSFRCALALCAVATTARAQARYPESPVVPVIDTLHGTVLTDPYRWLEDQEAAATRAWIVAQNVFSDSVMAGVGGRETIAARLGELLMTDQQGIPLVRRNRYFYSRRPADQDFSALYMRDGPGGAEVALIDPNAMAAEVPLSATFATASLDGTLMVYGIRRGGEDELLYRFYDVNRRRVLPDHLPKGRYPGVVLTPDNRAIYYVRHTREGPRLYTRGLGGGSGTERLLFGDGLGGDMGIRIFLSRNGRWMLLSVDRGTSGGNDLYLMDVEAGTAPAPMVTGTDRTYNASFAGERIVIHTNWEASNGRVLIATTAAHRREQWRPIVAEGEHPIAGVTLAGGYVWVRYLENVIGRIRGFDLEGRPFREIRIPEPGTIGFLVGQFESREAFYTFSSYTTPSTIYRYDIARDARTVWWRSSAPFAGEGYEVRQVWYPSRDGTRVPMFLAHRRGLPLDGSHPVFLTGYGGFNLSQTPGFSAQHAVWLEQGGVLAVPNLRGGGEFGEAWHEAGRLGRKQTVFDDFIAAAEWLIANRYTTAERLAIAGGSNGGLLVGAAVTQRPELFRAVVFGVPLLDMLRYHQFLLGSFWVGEYGSAADSAQFVYLRAYSPYHNVRPGTRYPAVLLETGDADTRVAPLHARKMTALLQAATSAGAAERPILLRYDTEAGHSGGLPVRKTIDDTSRRLAFVMWQLGMRPVARTAVRP